jgi:hypothetical protein
VSYYKILIAFNFFVCMGIVWMCLCRLNVSSVEVHPQVRAYYTLLLTGAMAYGLQAPLFGYIPTPAGIFFATCVAIGMLMSRARWSAGAPVEVKQMRPHTVGQ